MKIIHLQNSSKIYHEKTFNSNFPYTDDVLLLNNSRFDNYMHRIYPSEAEVKDTTDTQNSAS